jgi:hypothetical protein
VLRDYSPLSQIDDGGIVFRMLSSVSGAAPGLISVAKPKALPTSRVLVLLYQ